MEKIYHVAPKDHSGDLLSLFLQHGEKSYEIFASSWPESAELGQYHAHYVHCYATLDEARNHVAGGKIYEIDALALDDDYIKVEIDALEFAHPMVRDRIPAEYMLEVA